MTPAPALSPEVVAAVARMAERRDLFTRLLRVAGDLDDSAIERVIAHAEQVATEWL